MLLLVYHTLNDYEGRRVALELGILLLYGSLEH